MENQEKKASSKTQGCIFGIVILLLCGYLLFSFFKSCGKTQDKPKDEFSLTTQEDAYKKIETIFKGSVIKKDIQPMLEDVMTRYKIAINNENLLKTASKLIYMSNKSKVNVTEMDILKHMYQYGNSNETFDSQLLKSFGITETIK